MADSSDSTNPPPPPQTASATSRKGQRWTIAILLLLVGLWCLAMFYRMEIRAYWWARQLIKADTPQEKHYYLLCLAGAKDSAFGPAKGLVRNADPRIRELGVAVLGQCQGKKVEQLLVDLLNDPDEDVADAAAVSLTDLDRGNALAFVPQLQAILARGGRAGRHAIIALQRIPGQQTESILLNAISPAGDPDLLAQLFDSLGITGCRRATPLMIAALEDTRALGPMLYSERSAVRALAGASSQFSAKGLDPRSVTVQRARTVSEAALRSLLLIAGPSAPTAATSPAGAQDLKALRLQWEAWWQATSQPATKPQSLKTAGQGRSP
jgi:hypothetical protein